MDTTTSVSGDSSLQGSVGDKSVQAASSTSQVVSHILFLAVAFLAPLFFIPSAVFPFQFGKTLLIAIGTAVALILWIAGVLKTGFLSLPRSGLFGGALLVLIAFAVSTLLSPSIKISWSGQGFEVGTFAFLLVSFAVFFLASTLLSTRRKILLAYGALGVGALVVFVFQALRLVFGADFLPLNVFGGATSNLIGRWNELAIFGGFTTVLLLSVLAFANLERRLRILSFATLVLSLFLLAVVNFPSAWFVVAVFSLIIGLYQAFFVGPRTPADTSLSGWGKLSRVWRRLPAGPIAVLAIAVLFYLGSGSIGSRAVNFFGTPSLEARPSFAGTLSIAGHALREHPFFGTGPSRFVNEWVLAKPADINQTIFWDIDFNYGVGLLPTYLVTTGIVGALAWVIFLLGFLAIGFRSLIAAGREGRSRVLIVSSFLSALFLWVFSVFYAPGPVLTFLTFFMTGVFVAVRSVEGSRTKTFSLGADPKVGFVAVLVLVFFLVGALVLAYGTVRRYVGAVHFQRAALGLNAGQSPTDVSALVRRAADASGIDLYYRFLAEVELVRLQSIIASAGQSLPVEDARTEFQRVYAASLEAAQKAVEINPDGYENHLTLARVYEVLVPLNVSGAYESADRAYTAAVAKNATNPGISLMRARLEVAKGDRARARTFVTEALQKKNNFIDAVFLLSQIEAAEGNIAEAIRSAEAATILAPQDPLTFFQLGILHYSANGFREAAAALEQATALNPSYANAKYFLGLAYDRLGRRQNAIEQFKDLSITNPDNTEVKLILANLEAGRAPFIDAKPPVDARPEKRSKLPVLEDAGAPR